MATTNTKYWTLSEIKNKIKNDLALHSEVFIDPEELVGYINEAIDECEAEIHSLYEDYFLAMATVTLSTSTDTYNLPEDIYAHKIRRVVYKNGSTIYEIPRIRELSKFLDYEVSRQYVGTCDYKYFIYNKTPGSPQLLITPPARESGEYVRVWYLRQANRLEDDTDVCDVPEFVSFICQYVKTRCYEKELHPMYGDSKTELERQRTLMQGVLTQMVPDSNNEIELDLSHYEEMV